MKPRRCLHWFGMLAGWCALAVSLGTGCGRLQVKGTVERTLQIDGMGGDNIKSLSYTPTSWQQSVKVLVRTDGPPVDVYLVLERDQAALETQLGNQQAVTVQTLAKAEKVTEKEIEATVPAGNGFAVVLVNNGTKNASVAVKIATEKK
ncbi:MAG: hypothetical protein NZM31_04775 [Gemmatales bacterium]|nr:hypothetical protein [Gemmatales bacterium]MDW8386312.1 hypothetical protein [Gemmatales bacterium]